MYKELRTTDQTNCEYVKDVKGLNFIMMRTKEDIAGRGTDVY